jgi:hypothetical protein
MTVGFTARGVNGVASKHLTFDPPMVCDDRRLPLHTSVTMNRNVPLLIRVFIWFAALASVGMYLSILLAVLDIGPHIMGGERVTRTEWLHIAAPLVAVIGILMACIAYGFATQKGWSRYVVIAMFGLIVVYAAILGALNLMHHAIMWRAIINASLFGAASVWYFYFKRNIAAYFRDLSDR